MKKILIILDGLADKGSNTSLAKAKTPNLDFLASNGTTGLMYPIKGIAPESGESQFAILGQALKNYPGRGILESLGINIKINPKNTYLRCNFAKIKGNKIIHIRDKIPSKDIIKKINKIDPSINIIPTLDYRAVMIVKNASPSISNTHPGYIRYKTISKAVTGTNLKKECKPLKNTKLAIQTAKRINNFIKKLEFILKNKTLLIRGAGNSLPKIKPLKNWNLIADMPVELGLGRLLKMHILKKEKNEINQIIRSKNNIYVQIKGPDIYGHRGNLKGKIKAIEKIDKFLKPLTKLKNTIIIITSDHATPYTLKRHSSDPVPLLIYGKGKEKIKNKIKKFSEKECKKGSLGKIQGKDLLKYI